MLLIFHVIKNCDKIMVNFDILLNCDIRKKSDTMVRICHVMMNCDKMVVNLKNGSTMKKERKEKMPICHVMMNCDKWW